MCNTKTDPLTLVCYPDWEGRQLGLVRADAVSGSIGKAI